MYHWPAFRIVVYHNPVQTRGLALVKFVWSLQFIWCWVPMLNLHQKSCTEVALGFDHKATHFTWATDKSSDTKNFGLLIDTVWMESPFLLQRWKSLCQFISHLLFIIRKCKMVSLQERYSLLDPSWSLSRSGIKKHKTSLFPIRHKCLSLLSSSTIIWLALDVAKMTHFGKLLDNFFDR